MWVLYEISLTAAKIKIQVSSDQLRNVLSDLTGRRRGAIHEMTPDKHLTLLSGKAPLKVTLKLLYSNRIGTPGLRHRIAFNDKRNRFVFDGTRRICST